jgi:hypothetical protein
MRQYSVLKVLIVLSYTAPLGGAAARNANHSLYQAGDVGGCNPGSSRAIIQVRARLPQRCCNILAVDPRVYEAELNSLPKALNTFACYEGTHTCTGNK